MNRFQTLLIFSVAVIFCSCSPYKKNGFNNNQQPGATANTDPNSSGNSSEANTTAPKPITADTPTEAQKDGKTFLVISDEEALHGLKEGDAQTKIVCDRNVGKVNKVTTAFCTNAMRPKSLIELQTALGLAFPANAAAGRNANGTGGNPGYAVQGHSSSLVGKFVSAINPRVIIFDPSNAMDVVMGFVRGEQFAELAVKNTDNTFDFFLVGFKQACNAKPEGCSAGELLTPAVEKDWTLFTLYQDEDLKNTIVDCRHCHQPDGPQTQKILRMQELVNPWTHWFRDNTDGRGLATDYTAAHGTTEVYGGIPAGLIGTNATGSDPAKLENFVRNNGFTDNSISVTNKANAQPNQFDTVNIRTEVAAATRVNAANVPFLGTAACPIQATATTNSPSKSPRWDGALWNFMNRSNACVPGTINQGQTFTVSKKNFIPPPYHELRVTDPAALAKFTKQYQDFNAGTVTAANFVDHRNAFVVDQKELAEVGFAVDPAMAPADMLKLACTQCHQSDLDQSQSRAKFNAVDFSKMANLNAELDIAISRLRLGYSPERLKAEGVKLLAPDGSQMQLERGEHLLTMPPRRFRVLSDLQIDSLIKFLESQKK